MHTLMRITPLALAALAGTAFAAPPAADDGGDVQALANQLSSSNQLRTGSAAAARTGHAGAGHAGAIEWTHGAHRAGNGGGNGRSSRAWLDATDVAG